MYQESLHKLGQCNLLYWPAITTTTTIICWMHCMWWTCTALYSNIHLSDDIKDCFLTKENVKKILSELARTAAGLLLVKYKDHKSWDYLHCLGYRLLTYSDTHKPHIKIFTTTKAIEVGNLIYCANDVNKSFYLGLGYRRSTWSE